MLSQVSESVISLADGILMLYILRKWSCKAGNDLLESWCLGWRMEIYFIKCVCVLITKSRKFREKELKDPYACHMDIITVGIQCEIDSSFSSKYTFLRTNYCHICGFHFSQSSIVWIFHSFQY